MNWWPPFGSSFSFVGSHRSARTCRVETCAPSGEAEALEVSGALRDRKERSGEDEQQQRGQRQHCGWVDDPVVQSRGTQNRRRQNICGAGPPFRSRRCQSARSVRRSVLLLLVWPEVRCDTGDSHENGKMNYSEMSKSARKVPGHFRKFAVMI